MNPHAAGLGLVVISAMVGLTTTAQAETSTPYAGAGQDARDIKPASLTELTTDAADLRGTLRAAHLAAHLETKPVLSQHQIMIYTRLRGYGGDAGHGGHSGHGHHGAHGHQ